MSGLSDPKAGKHSRSDSLLNLSLTNLGRFTFVSSYAKSTYHPKSKSTQPHTLHPAQCAVVSHNHRKRLTIVPYARRCPSSRRLCYQWPEHPALDTQQLGQKVSIVNLRLVSPHDNVSIIPVFVIDWHRTICVDRVGLGSSNRSNVKGGSTSSISTSHAPCNCSSPSSS